MGRWSHSQWTKVPGRSAKPYLAFVSMNENSALLSAIVDSINEDVRTACRKDPALHGRRTCEIILYQGLWAVWSYRVAHELWQRDIPLVPRMVSQAARFMTGIEIHPGASIGRRLFIDHGMGTVIGESAEIGDDVMIYHNVTLGARGWWSDAKGAKRHPTIGDRVVLGSGCSVLGPVSVGCDSRIGAGALVVENVPSGSVVSVTPNTPRAPRTPTPAPATPLWRTNGTHLPQRSGAHRPHTHRRTEQVRS